MDIFGENYNYLYMHDDMIANYSALIPRLDSYKIGTSFPIDPDFDWKLDQNNV